jgi:catechol 2,3-dioxygenase-like lactoylglutathione lyase family enzyme
MPVMQSVIPAAYVRDIDASRAFYGLLGFHEIRAGQADAGAWSLVQHDRQSILLTLTRPPLEIPPLPLLFYFFFEDLEAVAGLMQAAGITAEHQGYPPHALGGEYKVLDPDGNAVLLAQRERSPSQPAQDDNARSDGYSVLKEAAALVAALGTPARTCQIRDLNAGSCRKQAEVKLADSWGDTAWACLSHAGEILVSVRGAFIASRGDHGVAEFLSRRPR